MPFPGQSESALARWRGAGSSALPSVDQWGVWASAFCVLHCLLTPVILSLSAVSVHFLPSEERTHRLLAVVIAALGVVAVLRGFRRHRRVRVILLMATGLACIWGTALWGERLPTHAMEIGITAIGSFSMIAAHRLNHTFCADCKCSEAPHCRG